MDGNYCLEFDGISAKLYKGEDKEEYNLIHFNVEKFLITITDNLNFIYNLAKTFCHQNYSYFNQFFSEEELIYFTFHIYIYYSLHWDNIPKYSFSSLYIYFRLREFLNEFSKQRILDSLILDYRYYDLTLLQRFIESFCKINVKCKNKNNIIKFLISYESYILLFYFLTRKLIIKSQRIEKIDILFIDNYDRYFDNKNFFDVLLNEDNFYHKLNIKKYKNKFIFYSKLGNKNILKYIRDSYRKFNYELFIEDLISLNSIFKFLSFYPKYNFEKIEILKSNIDKNNIEKKYIVYNFIDFIKRKFLFLVWLYINIKNFIKKTEVKIVIGSSEKALTFYIINIAKNFLNKQIQTIAFSHEVITRKYLYIPYKSYSKFSNYPDLKVVFTQKGMEIIKNKYKYPSKILLYEDPREIYIKNLPKKRKTILIVSQGFPDFYKQLFITLNKYKWILEKFKIYFKPHPTENLNKDLLKNLESNKIEIIKNLNFVPEYAIGNCSSLLKTLLVAGSKIYYTNKIFEDFLDENIKEKAIYKDNVEEIFKDIINNQSC